ncbi:PACE efflux transporter [Marinobacter daepoensis]|uniref:PACE efflux transporter n=1 Tax=Marinobacter daepoensis TaxID=262077 RepID=A0ABS3BKZ5_9GAMM|nr:PACE efflux transporter [Marinobacter daepoensis]MBN7771516.1 PACE efflux transporter [Marinobacter daepoensis]MBY6034214.1 PACE efflux transporter [Marinobacter daepoensis]MBY6080116.1 PACE efflux transporter [Marinobacter daepoensis]
MRTPKDRVRQAILFEGMGLLLSIPLAAISFGFDLGKTSILGIVGATMATFWNYVFNLGFDHFLKRRYGSTRKSIRVRFVHAISFELGLMLAFLPVIAWWMGIGLVDALIVDIAFVVFYLVYAFIFTWCYDTVFPDSDAKEPPPESNPGSNTQDTEISAPTGTGR